MFLKMNNVVNKTGIMYRYDTAYMYKCACLTKPMYVS